MDDDRIVALYFARDEQAIEETRRKYSSYCKRLALNILGNMEDAEEIENDTYLGIWNAIPPTRPASFSAFIGRITRNLALKRLRFNTAEKRRISEGLISLDELGKCVSDADGIAIGIEAEELSVILNSFLHSLNKTERSVFVCRYWYCDSIADICRQFGFGQSKVKMMLSRTREKLSIYLKERGVLF